MKPNIKNKVLVIGGSGYIGTIVSNYLRKNSYFYRKVDIFDAKIELSAKIEAILH